MFNAASGRPRTTAAAHTYITMILATAAVCMIIPARLISHDYIDFGEHCDYVFVKTQITVSIP
jgi:hypothetical protein